MKIYLGVDFGAKGALAALDESGKILNVIKTPLKSGTDEIDCFQVYSWLYENFNEYDYEVIACGEKLHAIFKAAASTTFSFGKNVGKIVGIIECLDMEYVEVRAVDWQNYMFTTLSIPETHQTKKTPSGKLKKDTKIMAKAAVSKLWPKQDTKHDGINDALLIAEFARKTHGTQKES
jgi:hypothetical protein